MVRLSVGVPVVPCRRHVLGLLGLFVNNLARGDRKRDCLVRLGRDLSVTPG